MNHVDLKGHKREGKRQAINIDSQTARDRKRAGKADASIERRAKFGSPRFAMEDTSLSAHVAKISEVLQAPGGYMRKRGEQSGSIRRKGKSWTVRFSEFVRDGGNLIWRETEKKIRDIKAGDGEKAPRDVQRAAAAMVADANKLQARPGSTATFSEFVEARYRAEMQQLSKCGRKQYEYLLKDHILPTLGPIRLADISADLVQSLINEKASLLSPRTVKHVAKVISIVMDRARALGFADGRLHMKDVRLPRLPRRDVRVLGYGDIERLAKVLPPDAASFVWVLWHTGLRVGELCGLRWECVNLGDTAVRLTSGEWLPPGFLFVCRAYHHSEWTDVKSASGRRLVPMVPALVGLLKAHREKTKAAEQSDCVFTSRVGTPVDYHNLAQRVIRPAAEKLGIKANFHLMRHSFATRIDGVLTPAEKLGIMGHASAAMSTHYTHPQAEALAEAIRKVN